jgi:hypothetical protein
MKPAKLFQALDRILELERMLKSYEHMPLHEVNPETEQRMGQEYHGLVSSLRNISLDDMRKYHSYVQEKFYSLEQTIRQYEQRFEEQERRHKQERTFTAIESATLQG